MIVMLSRTSILVLVGWTVLAVIATSFVVGCGSVPSSASASPMALAHHPGQPAGAKLVRAPSGLGWMDTAIWGDQHSIAVVTWGSSGCPRYASRADAQSPNAINVQITGDRPPSGVSCTADLSPTTSVVPVPSSINLNDPVTVVIVDGEFGTTVVLQSRSGA